MAEKIDKLVRMANQIAAFFGPYSDEEAASGIQEHIRAFWTRGMREEFVAYAESGGVGIMPRVMAAVEHFRTVESPAHKATAGPGEVGEMASDAG